MRSTTEEALREGQGEKVMDSRSILSSLGRETRSTQDGSAEFEQALYRLVTFVFRAYSIEFFATQSAPPSSENVLANLVTESSHGSPRLRYSAREGQPTAFWRAPLEVVLRENYAARRPSHKC